MFVQKIKRLVRPFITFCLMGTFSYLAVTGKIPPKEVVLLVAIITAFYFGERSASKKPDND